MSDPYRGDDEASALRLEQLDAEITDKEARLTGVFWDRVAPVWGVGRALQGTGDPRQARHSRLEMLDQAIARARTGPWAQATLPVPEEPKAGLLGPLDRAASIKPMKTAAVLAVARFYSSRSEMAYRGSQRWAVRFSVEGAPIEIAVERHTLNNRVYERAILTATVAPAAELSLQPEGILHSLLDVLGLSDEIELNDPAFDPVYVIKGDREAADTYLSPSARTALLAADVEVPPALRMRDGIAALTTLSVNEAGLRRLTDLLASWHSAPSPFALLRDPAPDIGTSGP